MSQMSFSPLANWGDMDILLRIQSWTIFSINSLEKTPKTNKTASLFTDAMAWSTAVISPRTSKEQALPKRSDLTNALLCQDLVAGLLLLGTLASARLSDLAHWSHFPDDIRTVNCFAPRSSQVSVYKLTECDRSDGL